ncbi:16S rRNA (guanine(527)-N(7))-methyltransferase RsmG [Roseivirga sp. BDSF3-8]|uniref:16S rRNA (guanine(527)-N(7))-methyltransferase RsmG n=1 Tax=Roseivirga sp. BDSF3-8 TaxID=3241598 RepID=UPI00353213EC
MEKASLIYKYFPNLTEKQKAQFEALDDLYREWNTKINLISRKDIDHLYGKHVLHSLAIAKIVQFQPGTLILDVGTGGGFPGIPLAILFPEVEFHLVDSIGKKITVVEAVIEDLKLVNARAEKIRAEQIDGIGAYEFVVSRAVTRLKPLYSWVKPLISTVSHHDLPNGVISLKGGDLTDELHEANLSTRVWDIPDIFPEEYFDTKKIVYARRGKKG